MECSTNARHGQCTRFPVVAAAPFPFLFHRTGIGGVHGDVYRFHPPPGGTDGVRNVDRRRSGRDLAPFPRPPILRRNPLGRAAGSGSRREFHPPAPTDPGVTVSGHRALVILITRRREPISSCLLYTSDAADEEDS